MKKYEYRTLRVAFGMKAAADDSLRWLNELGDEGWEAVTSMGQEQGGRVLLKREKD